MYEVWEKIFADVELTKKILPLEPEDVKKELDKAGYDVSVEEIIEVGEELNAALKQAEDGEMSIEQLETVVGGRRINGHIICAGVGVAIGIAAVCAPW